MARKATWQSHADPRGRPRGRLRGTRGHVGAFTYYIYYIYSYSTYKHSVLGTRPSPIFFSVWDYVPFLYFVFRTRGTVQGVGLKSQESSRVSAVEFRSTRSLINACALIGFK